MAQVSFIEALQLTEHKEFKMMAIMLRDVSYFLSLSDIYLYIFSKNYNIE